MASWIPKDTLTGEFGVDISNYFEWFKINENLSFPLDNTSRTFCTSKCLKCISGSGCLWGTINFGSFWITLKYVSLLCFYTLYNTKLILENMLQFLLFVFRSLKSHNQVQNKYLPISLISSILFWLSRQEHLYVRLYIY